MKKGARHGMILQQPWARLVAEGVFSVLVRPIPTHIRGRVAIVARGVDPAVLVDGERPTETDFPRPAIIGYVNIRECIEVPHDKVKEMLKEIGGRELADLYPLYYLPRKSRAFIWVLRNPHARVRPKLLNKIGARTWIRLEGTA